ncbi:hypothetical protein E4J93_03825 [Collinsella sp. BA40]|uniref:hypothetical protein n=1 Tax=Collinsella sp. BA40 TaxID=2560852 RepID=UPI0011C9256A|nr:hypothetical protein [Collinsella sp. BA40]TXF36987.1 hypothetical protein E4J93_03825 [Collinsella sp. BA40]
MRMTERERALEERFEEAERMGLLLWPESNAELKALSRRVQSGRVVRPWTGMYAREGFWETMDGQERKRAVCILKTRALMWPGTVYCGVSAAVLHGLWVSHALLGQIHILSARTRGGGSVGFSGRRAAAEDGDADAARTVFRAAVAGQTVEVQGCRATDIVSTLIDCAIRLPLHEALPLFDCALRYRLVEKDELLRFLNRCNFRGIRAERAFQAIAYADGRSENGGESLVRGLIYELGYMPPHELQMELEDPIDEGQTMRADQFWDLPEGGVVGEVDGLGKYREGALQELVKERRRESHIAALGYRVMRIQFARVFEPGYLEGLLKAFGIPRREGDVLDAGSRSVE